VEEIWKVENFPISVDAYSICVVEKEKGKTIYENDLRFTKPKYEQRPF